VAGIVHDNSGSWASWLSSDVLDSLIREADLFAMASHLHWALWSLPMALSDMAGKFGYMEYGRSRMEEYLRLKALRT
jgi:hypothetical protein